MLDTVSIQCNALSGPQPRRQGISIFRFGSLFSLATFCRGDQQETSCLFEGASETWQTGIQLMVGYHMNMMLMGISSSRGIFQVFSHMIHIRLMTSRR